MLSKPNTHNNSKYLVKKVKMAGSKSTNTGASKSTKSGGSSNAKVSTSKGPAGSSAETKIGAANVHGSAGKVMKAPGQDGFISRQAFESSPKSYFQGLRD